MHRLRHRHARMNLNMWMQYTYATHHHTDICDPNSVLSTSIVQDTRNFTEAVKIIDLRKSAESGDISKSTQRAVINELVAWQQVGENRNVVQLLDFMWDTTLCYFVMERCSSTSLLA
eukprot:3708458-Karenia_brevis.AAC.1